MAMLCCAIYMLSEFPTDCCESVGSATEAEKAGISLLYQDGSQVCTKSDYPFTWLIINLVLHNHMEWLSCSN